MFYFARCMNIILGAAR